VKKTPLVFLCLLVVALSLIATIPAPAAGVPATPTEEIYLGLGEGVAGENGWVVSDYIAHVISPADTLVNGKPVQDGQYKITSDGRHRIEFQPGPSGQANTITQFVYIDKTAPTVTWTTEQNVFVSGWATLDAELSDETSGLCSVEASFDHGQSWDVSNLAPMTPNGVTIHHETTWSISRSFKDFPKGAQVILLRARDCAGNVSPGEILVIRIE